MAKKIVLVGHDVAPTRAFQHLMQATTRQDFEIESFLADGGEKGEIDIVLMRRAIRAADFVLIGMSSPQENASAEIAAAQEARKSAVPYGLYSDTFGAFNREWFWPCRENAAMLFLPVGGGEVDEARRLFTNANIVVTGNPLWEEYSEPQDTDASRALISASHDDFVILCPGDKSAINTIMLWGAVMEAGYTLSTNIPVVIVLAAHPGDKTPPEIYAPFFNLGTAMDVRVVKTPRGAKADDLVAGANVIVHRNTSVGIHALYKRKPVVDFYGPLAQEFLRRATGKTQSYFYGTGAVFDLYIAREEWADFGSLASILRQIHKQEGLNLVDRAALENLLPTLKIGEAANNMKKALEKFLA